MNCPLCIDQMLVVHRRGGIEIDVCPNCHGVWLDRDELDRLMGQDAADHRASVVEAPGTAGALREGGGTGKAKGKKKSKDKGTDKKPKKKRTKSLGERLGDVLEDVLDI